MPIVPVEWEISEKLLFGLLLGLLVVSVFVVGVALVVT